MYSLGYGLLFFVARCVRRSLEKPQIVGSAAALLGYLSAMKRRDPVLLPADVVDFLRAEQRGKLLGMLGRRPVSTSRPGLGGSATS